LSSSTGGSAANPIAAYCIIYIYIYISELIYTHKEGRRLKPIAFLGDALDLLRAFPEGARKEAGVQLHKVQQGLPPSDWKPMRTIGPGVAEIRIHDEADAFRVIYIARRDDAVYVLHAFQKEDPADREARFGPCGDAAEANLNVAGAVDNGAADLR
jgi:phage-related protein